MTLLAFDTDLSKHQNIQNPIAADVYPGDWFISYMSYAKTVGLVYPDYLNNLYPGKELNRGECAEISYKMLLLINGGESQKLLSMTEAKVIGAIVAYYNNRINEAISLTAEAVTLADQAVASKPESTVMTATKTYVSSYEKAFLAHRKFLEGQITEATTLAQEAKQLANQAIGENSAITEFANRAIQISDDLLTKI